MDLVLSVCGVSVERDGLCSCQRGGHHLLQIIWPLVLHGGLVLQFGSRVELVYEIGWLFAVGKIPIMTLLDDLIVLLQSVMFQRDVIQVICFILHYLPSVVQVIISLTLSQLLEGMKFVCKFIDVIGLLYFQLGHCHNAWLHKVVIDPIITVFNFLMVLLQ